MTAVQYAIRRCPESQSTQAGRALRALIVATALVSIALTPPAAPAQGLASAQSQAVTEKFILSGVIVFEGGKGLAWIQEPTLTGNQVVALRPGDNVGPYRLTRVLQDRVELEGPAGTVLVPVYGAAGAPAAPSTSVAAAPREIPAATPAPRAADIDPNAMSRRDIREATERLREAKQAMKASSRPEVQSQRPAAPEEKQKGRWFGRRGGKSPDGGASVSGASGGGHSIAISRSDPRRNGFQSLIQSGAAGN